MEHAIVGDWEFWRRRPAADGGGSIAEAAGHRNHTVVSEHGSLHYYYQRLNGPAIPPAVGYSVYFCRRVSRRRALRSRAPVAGRGSPTPPSRLDAAPLRGRECRTCNAAGLGRAGLCKRGRPVGGDARCARRGAARERRVVPVRALCRARPWRRARGALRHLCPLPPALRRPAGDARVGRQPPGRIGRLPLRHRLWGLPDGALDVREGVGPGCGKEELRQQYRGGGEVTRDCFSQLYVFAGVCRLQAPRSRMVRCRRGGRPRLRARRARPDRRRLGGGAALAPARPAAALLGALCCRAAPPARVARRLPRRRGAAGGAGGSAAASSTGLSSAPPPQVSGRRSVLAGRYVAAVHAPGATSASVNAKRRLAEQVRPRLRREGWRVGVGDACLAYRYRYQRPFPLLLRLCSSAAHSAFRHRRVLHDRLHRELLRW